MWKENEVFTVVVLPEFLANSASPVLRKVFTSEVYFSGMILREFDWIGLTVLKSIQLSLFSKSFWSESESSFGEPYCSLSDTLYSEELMLIRASINVS